MNRKAPIKPQAAAQAALAPWAAWSDLGRQQFAMAADGASAMFRGFEAMRKVQEQAAHEAAQRHARAADRLRSPCQPTDLMAIQSDLLGFDVQGASRYWRDLAAAAMEMQTELAGCAGRLVDSSAVLEAASALDAVDVPPSWPFTAGTRKSPARPAAAPRAR
jgi:hypothetical protein